AIPNARFVELPGADHLPFVGDQESILSEIERFIAGVRAVEEHDWVLAAVLAADVAQVTPEVEDELRWFRGRALIDHTGVLATFDGPERAVRCAASLVGRVQGRGLPAGAGVPLGECPHPSTGKGRGPAIEVAAHIRSAAEPGEVVVSST